MPQAFLAEMKVQLLAKKAKLEAELRDIGHAAPGAGENLDPNFPDYGDKEDENASEVAAFSDNLSVEHTLEATLQDVDRALARIAEGTYGKCKYCGQDIDERRLRARPESGSCVKCKQELLSRP